MLFELIVSNHVTKIMFRLKVLIERCVISHANKNTGVEFNAHFLNE